MSSKNRPAGWPHNDKIPDHQTVQYLVDRLSQYPPTAKVGFATDPGSCLQILSIYRQTEDEGGAVWIDLEEDAT